MLVFLVLVIGYVFLASGLSALKLTMALCGISMQIETWDIFWSVIFFFVMLGLIYITG